MTGEMGINSSPNHKSEDLEALKQLHDELVSREIGSIATGADLSALVGSDGEVSGYKELLTEFKDDIKDREDKGDFSINDFENRLAEVNQARSNKLSQIGNLLNNYHDKRDQASKSSDNDETITIQPIKSTNELADDLEKVSDQEKSDDKDTYDNDVLSNPKKEGFFRRGWSKIRSFFGHKKDNSDKAYSYDTDFDDETNHGQHRLVKVVAGLAAVATLAGIWGGIAGNNRRSKVDQAIGEMNNANNQIQVYDKESPADALKDLNKLNDSYNGNHEITAEASDNPGGAWINPFDSISSGQLSRINKLSADSTKDNLEKQIAEEKNNISILGNVDTASARLAQINKFTSDQRKVQADGLIQELDGAMANMSSRNEANTDEDKANIQSKIDALKAEIDSTKAQINADKLGVNVEDYKSYGAAASETGLSIDKIKEYAQHYDIPADKLGTAEAQNYMRNQMAANGNVGEAYTATDSEEAKNQMIFAAYNNPAALAMYKNAINEAGGVNDGLIDGFKTPANVDSLYQQYLSDGQTKKVDFDNFKTLLNGAKISARQATNRIGYSYFINGQNRMTTSRVPENSNGANEMVYDVVLSDGTQMIVKQGCEQLWIYVAPKVVYTRYTVTKTYNPVTPNQPSKPSKPVVPVKPPVTPPKELQPKNEHDNDKQQNDAVNFNDNAKAKNETQHYEPVDKSNNSPVPADTQKNSGNTDGNASNGSEYVPTPDDNKGNINGRQDELPIHQDW